MNALYDKSKFRQGEKIKKLEEENKELWHKNQDLMKRNFHLRYTIKELEDTHREEQNRKQTTEAIRGSSGG